MKGLAVEAYQLPVVIQHLFEVRGQPLAVHRVAGEAAVGLVVNAAPGHLAQGQHGLVQHRPAPANGVGPQQKPPDAGHWKLRGAVRAAALAVETSAQIVHQQLEFFRGNPRRAGLEVYANGFQGGVISVLGRVAVLRAVLGQLAGANNFHKPLSRLLQLGAVLAGVGLADVGQQLGPFALREVRAAVKRLRVGGQKHVQRPAALQAHGVHGIHVNLVHVGPFLAVDFDAHKMRVHHRRHRLVLKRLPLHYVAPVAGRVANAHQNGLLFGLRPAQGLGAPRVPVHRIVGVLLQVGAGFLGEAVGGSSGLGHSENKLGRGTETPNPAKRAGLGKELTQIAGFKVG